LFSTARFETGSFQPDAATDSTASCESPPVGRTSGDGAAFSARWLAENANGNLACGSPLLWCRPSWHSAIAEL